MPPRRSEPADPQRGAGNDEALDQLAAAVDVFNRRVRQRLAERRQPRALVWWRRVFGGASAGPP